MVLPPLLDAHRAMRGGPAAIAQRQLTRLSEMVAFARTRSPYYRELYQDLPERIEDSTQLPVTDKKELMARFDNWVTDRDATVQQVRSFVDNPDLVGERFLGKYTVATTSGTTGTRGIFLLDDLSFAVTSALVFRMLSTWLTAGEVLRIIAGGGRLAMVNAMGGHFASAVAATRLRSRRGNRIQVFPVHLPMPEVVTRLNPFRPVILASYASMAALLASEQEAGRMHIKPVLVVLSAEGLPAGAYDRIARAFKAKVRDSYAATECPFMSYRCEQGWLHANCDWALLEPVDADYRPVPPGVQSHTVLLCNLANRVQPILRYDLGDSILQRPDPCPCGNPLPAFRVHGRAADLLTFPGADGESVVIPPLVFSTLADRTPGVDLLQLVQHAPANLRVRLQVANGAEPDRVRGEVYAGLIRLLTSHKLGHVTVELAQEAPVQSSGGKYRQVILLA